MKNLTHCGARTRTIRAIRGLIRRISARLSVYQANRNCFAFIIEGNVGRWRMRRATTAST